MRQIRWVFTLLCVQITLSLRVFERGSSDSCASSLPAETSAYPVPAMRKDAEVDIVIYGFYGLTWGLAAHWLATRPGNFTYAIAGRERWYLDKFAGGLDRMKVRRLPTAVMVADAGDREALRAMVRRARVVISAAGPFTYFGPELVKVCVEEGTHYVDVTGEQYFVHDMIDKYHAVAERKGVKIVHSAGVVAVPFDLSVHLALDTLEEKLRTNHQLRNRIRIKGYLTEMTGGFFSKLFASYGYSESLQSGIASGKAALERPELANDPYLLAPGMLCRVDQKVLEGPKMRFDAEVQKMTVPDLIFGSIDSLLIRRSLEVTGRRNVSYEERMAIDAVKSGGPPRSITPVDGYCDIILCEKVSESLQKTGLWRSIVVAETEDGTAQAKIDYLGREDPGYKHTGKLLAEVGMCLTDASCHNPSIYGGVLSPASATSRSELLSRLRTATTDSGEPLVTLTIA